MEKCSECGDNEGKYKCPKCYSRYCSVACCKQHKGKACEPVTKDGSPKPPDTEIASKAAELQSSMESEDFVSIENLAQLGDSGEVRECLANPHLRAMLENLVNSEDPSREMDVAMREPIFSEFATACLKVVEPQDENAAKS